MTIVQQGDVNLFQTADGGEITVENGITEMSGCFSTAAYLSLFGGNEDDDGSSKNVHNWWGNLDETDPVLQYRSETQNLLQALPATTGNLRRIEDAVNRDLAWFIDLKVASSITIQVTMPAINTIDIFISIIAEGVESSFTFTENWKACLNESNSTLVPLDGVASINNPVIPPIVSYASYIASLFPVAWYRVGEASSALPMVDEIAALNGVYINPVTLGVSGLIFNDVDTALQPSAGGYGILNPLYFDLVLSYLPILHFRFNNITNDTTAFDVSGSSNVHNGTFLTPSNVDSDVSLIEGSDNGSCIINGLGVNKLTIAHHTDFNNISGVGFTVMGVYKPNAYDVAGGTFPLLYTKLNHYDIYVNNGKLEANIASSPVTSSITLIAGTSYHFAIVHEVNQDVKIYLQGVLDVTGLNLTPRPINTNDVVMGNIAALGNHMEGTLDEIDVYNFPLTPTEILNAHNRVFFNGPIFTPNVITISPPFTINTWVNFITSANTVLVQNNLREGYSIETDNGFIKIYANSTLLATSTTAINNGGDHYIAIALDTTAGSSVDSGLWIDGVLDVPVLLDTNNPNSTLFIGGEGATKTYPGVVDEVVFFDKILTAAEHTQANSLGTTPPLLFDVTNLIYTGDSFDVGAVAPSFRVLAWLSDGTKFYTTDSGGTGLVREYDVGTPWIPSTASYSGVTFNPTPAAFPLYGIFIKLDGSGFWVGGLSGGKQQIHQYTMTAGDLSTASYASKILDVSAQIVSRTDGLFFNNDYSKCYVNENFPGQTIYQYNLSVPGDISTGTFVGSLNTSVGNVVDYPIACYIRQDDELKLFVSGIRDSDGEGLVAQYDLSVAGDVSGGIYDGVTTLTTPTAFAYEPAIWFRPDGIRALIGDSGNDEVYEFTT